MPKFEITVNITHTFVDSFDKTYQIEADSQEEAEEIAEGNGWDEDDNKWNAELDDTDVDIVETVQLADDEPLTVRCPHTPDMFAGLL